MNKSKSQKFQMRIDAELLQRYKNFADSQGMSVSVALRQTMLRTCYQFDQIIESKKFAEERKLNKK